MSYLITTHHIELILKNQLASDKSLIARYIKNSHNLTTQNPKLLNFKKIISGSSHRGEVVNKSDWEP